jgi:hypothetical protein
MLYRFCQSGFAILANVRVVDGIVPYILAAVLAKAFKAG